MKAADLTDQTEYVLPGEKALGLQEVELLSPNGKDIHRYQIVYVVRNDKPAKYVTDLGSNLLFPNPPLNIIDDGGTVAELMDMATDARGRSSVTKRLMELQEESARDRNIIKEFLEQKERNWKIIRNQSHYGPTARIQRIGFNGK